MKAQLSKFIICLCITGSTVSAQEFAIDKKAIILSGSGSFMSKGGDLFEDVSGNKATTFNLTPSVDYFVAKNFFIGGGLDFSTSSQGNFSSNGIGIGPELGFAFGSAQSKAFPFLQIGILYYKMNYDFGSGDDSQFSGSNIFLGCGAIFPVKAHIGVILSGGYHMLDLKDREANESYSGNIFTIGIGITGLLF